MKEISNTHEFINNAIRIEILNKMICEDLEKKKSPNEVYLSDLETFLKDHLKLIQQSK